LIALLEPIWLVLLLPLGVAMAVWRPRTRAIGVLRGCVLVLVVLALSELVVRLPSRRGNVVLVADRSRSMPDGAEARALEALRLLRAAKSAPDELQLVVFGERAEVEPLPLQGDIAAFVATPGPDASDYAQALELALSLVPEDAPGRVLLLGDGRWTGRDPAAAAARAAARGIAIDHRFLERPTRGDASIARVETPASVRAGEGFLVTAWVQSPSARELRYELRRGGAPIASGSRTVPSGLSALTFRDRAGEPGVLEYTLEASFEGEDPVPENNTARFLAGVEGPKPVLHVTPAAASALTALLRAGKLAVTALEAERVQWTLEDLAAYSAVVLENIDAGRLGPLGMETLAAWVRDLGGGLVVTGGKRSYGAGGYFRSPLEAVLPVSMELRQEHRKLAVAIVVALDRSGSMSAPVGRGKTKMDLADLGAAEVLDMLSTFDEFGVLAVDSAAHVVSGLAPVADKEAVRARVLGIASEGGGIFVYEALSHAAEMLTRSSLGTRHIVLFADAADSEEPGAYRELLGKTSAAGITTSVIGLGSEADVDAELLKDIAARGGGSVYFTDRPEELPRLFAQDTLVVARSTFVEGKVAVHATGALRGLAGRDFEIDRSAGGYNLCYLREGAELGAVTSDDYAAPFTAFWHTGSGRAVAYTGEADGEFTGAIAGWADVGELFTSLVRWAAGGDRSLPGGAVLTQELRNGLLTVTVHLDPERAGEPFVEPPQAVTLRGVPGAAPEKATRPLSWRDADTLAVDVALRGGETAVTALEVSGAAFPLPPVTLPYSPEFTPVEAGRGEAALRALSAATGGESRDVLAEVWKDLPRRPRWVELSPWFLLAAAALLLLEVLERRTGVLSVLRGRARTPRVSAEREAGAEAKRRPSRARRRVLSPAAAAEPAAAGPPEKSTSEDESGAGLLDALAEARRKAEGRTQR
jgi:uncharacterized membrane protein